MRLGPSKAPLVAISRKTEGLRLFVDDAAGVANSIRRHAGEETSAREPALEIVGKANSVEREVSKFRTMLERRASTKVRPQYLSKTSASSRRASPGPADPSVDTPGSTHTAA